MKQRTQIQLGSLTLRMNSNGVVSVVAMTCIVALFLGLVLALCVLHIHQ